MDTTEITSFNLADRVREHPYQTLLLAAGVGYVLGGGLFTRPTLTLLRAGVKLATLPVIQGELIGVAVAALAARANPSP